MLSRVWLGYKFGAKKLVGSEDFRRLIAESEELPYLNMYAGTAKPEHFQKARGKWTPLGPAARSNY